MSRRRTPATPEVAADAGFPVEVRMPVDDGPLILTEPATGARAEYDVQGGVATASTRARLAQLVAIGGTPVVVSTPDPQGQGTPSPSTDGDTSA